ncbi:MAG: ABC transporter permease [Acidobacteriota bacterium]
MFERLKHMLIKEFIQVFRDPRMRTVIFIAPLIQIIIFGYVVTTDVKNIRTAIYDPDNSYESREVIARFVASDYFKIVEYVSNDDQVKDLLDHGRVCLVLKFNKGFGEIMRSGRSAPLQLLLDGTDSNSTSIVLKYTARITEGLVRDPVIKAPSGSVRPGYVALVSRAWFNENLESRNFYVPGVIALLLAVITLTLSSMAVVREKEIGTIEQVMVTPIRRVEFILGKTIPFMLIGIFDVILISLLAVYWFEVPIRGSRLLLFLSTLLYLVSMLSIGILISTICRTQQQAMLTGFFFIQPALLLSGFLYPIANMPIVVQWITYLDPIRYFLVIIRGVFLKGIGFDLLWPQMLGLFLLALLSLGLAALRFKKTMV